VPLGGDAQGHEQVLRDNFIHDEIKNALHQSRDAKEWEKLTPHEKIHNRAAMRRLLSALAAVTALIAAHAFAKDYHSFKEAMRNAIDSSDGKASGQLFGRAADRIANTTKSSDPVMIEITTRKPTQNI
jgi:hypothetical protein